MSNIRQDKSIETSFDRWGRAAWDSASRTLIRVVVSLLAGAIAIRSIDGLRIGQVEIVFLGGVLVASATFGLTSGLVAAAISLVTYHLIMGSTILPLDLRSPNTLFLALLALYVGVIGFYTDAVRGRQRQPHSLLEIGGHLSARASERAVGRFFDVARQKRLAVNRAPIAVEIRRAISSLGIIGAGLIAAFIARDLLGTTASILAALASALLIAGLMGARYGLAAGVLIGIFATLFLREPIHGGLPLQIGQAFVIFLVMMLSWGVGTLSDRLQNERAALKTLMDATRDHSTGTDEAANRQILFNSLCLIAQGGEVQLFDENGVAFRAQDARPDEPTASPPPKDDDRWRTHRLAADGRDVGFVRWRFPGSELGAQTADQIAISLIDLGASAIVRTRLNAERAEMEFVARAEHMRTILLDTVSHHFRSPLAGILGSVTSVLNLPERHDYSIRRELLLIIKEQANRLSNYVDNFLSLARLESGLLEINLSDVNIEALLYDVWETFGEVGSARRYLHVEVDPNPVRSDASLLAQVFGNILENAIKFSPEESLVRVRSRRGGDRLVVEVSDQGCGAPDDRLERMFERFYRNQGAIAPGLGLGLYITRSLVEMLGGSVTAHNRTDGGTGLIVLISLPLAETS